MSPLNWFVSLKLVFLGEITAHNFVCNLSLLKPFKVNIYIICSCIFTSRKQIPTAALAGILASDHLFVAFSTQTMSFSHIPISVWKTTLKNLFFSFKFFLQPCLCGNDRNHLSVISQLVWPLLIAWVTAVLLLFLCFLSICHIHLLSLISNLNLSSLDKTSKFAMLLQYLTQCVLSYMFSFNTN